MAISDEDNLADTETARANYDTAVYANVVDDAIVGLMDIKSIDATGFTAVMDDVDPSAYWVTYLAIGAAAAAGRTASLEQTQAADTPAATATLSLSGAAAPTQAADGLTALATLSIKAALTQAQAADSLTATGQGLVSTNGAVSVTQADATISCAGLVLDMAYARPTTDTYAGTWTNQAGGTTNLFDAINETTASDVDYVQSPASPSASAVTFALGALSTPSTDTAHVISYRYGKSPAGTTETLSLTVQLRQGYTNESSQGTLIAEWTHADISTTLATAEQVLSEVQAAAITDYAALFVRMTAGVV
jgi:hypothetical protein